MFLLICQALPAQAQTRMIWKFKEGETFYVENVTKSKQIIISNGQTTEQEKTTTAIASYRVVKTSEEQIVLEAKFESGKVEGNDRLGAAAMDLGQEFLKDDSIRIVLTPTGKILKIEAFDKLFEKLSGGNDEITKGIRAKLEEGIKGGLERSFGFLPDKPVVKGDKWKQEMRLPILSFGTMKSDSEYVYAGQQKGGDEFTFTNVWTYEKPREEDTGFVKVLKGTLKGEDSKGSVLFDAEAGRLVRLQVRTHFKGEFTTKLVDLERTIELEQDSTVTIRFLKDRPSK
jgi:outer membrane lipoprotein-sorting protein